MLHRVRLHLRLGQTVLGGVALVWELHRVRACRPHLRVEDLAAVDEGGLRRRRVRVGLLLDQVLYLNVVVQLR